MARRKGALSTVAAFMSDEAQTRLQQQNNQIAYIHINKLRPDPQQPRRLLPPDLAQAVATNDLSPSAAISAWQQRIQATEAGRNVVEDIRLNNWHELTRLADSIAQHGLINPVTVRPWPDKKAENVAYLIVTGERRYWSHVLLATQNRTIQTQEVEAQHPSKIKALISPEGISVRAHQLIENVQREDINAIEKAEGLWALRYELSGVTHGTPPQIESNKVKGKLVPWGEVEKSIGISKRHRIRLTSVLNLSETAQQIVAENGLTERAVRSIVAKLKQWPELQEKTLSQLAIWQLESEMENGLDRPIATLVDEMIERLLKKVNGSSTSSQPSQPQQKQANYIETGQKIQKRIQATRRFLASMKKDDLAEFSQAIPTNSLQEMVGELEQLQAHISTMLDVFKNTDG